MGNTAERSEAAKRASDEHDKAAGDLMAAVKEAGLPELAAVRIAIDELVRVWRIQAASSLKIAQLYEERAERAERELWEIKQR